MDCHAMHAVREHDVPEPRRSRCRHAPKTSSIGITHVLNAHSTTDILEATLHTPVPRGSGGKRRICAPASTWR
jgi:hypothetical protein